MTKAVVIFLGFSAAFLWSLNSQWRRHAGRHETIPDHSGNYDIDGVSYDPSSSQVIVSSDARAPDPHSDKDSNEKVVDLHSAAS